VGNDIAGIASLGHDTDFVFLAVGQVVGQVDAAIAVPHQLIGLSGLRMKHGSFIMGMEPARKPITISTLHSLSSRRAISLIFSVYLSWLGHLRRLLYKVLVGSERFDLFGDLADHFDEFGGFSRRNP
jgi:hypothetical protein